METRRPVSSNAACETVSAIDAWRERGDHRFDPVRFHFIEVLARRAAAHGGDTRRMLDDKLARLLAAYGEDLERARCADGHAGGRIAASPPRPPRGMLGELVDQMARHASLHGDRAATSDIVLKYFRSTWARLNVDRQLTQSLATVPKNAGPLNSHQLVHQSLTLMRDVSPEYLDRFMSYANALLSIHQVIGQSGVATANIQREESRKKPARRRSG